MAPESYTIPALGESLGGPASIALPVTEQSQVGEARRRAMALAQSAGLGEPERGTLAVIVTEAATNLARHASDGVLVLRSVGMPPSGVEILALDKGPGIRDLSKAMADGFSTAGSAGHGLGAIRRMASEFDLFSASESGTALFARVNAMSGARETKADRGLTGVVCTPMEGERACGDAWAIHRSPSRALVVLADGLGHGFEAALAGDVAIRTAMEPARRSPAQIIGAAHEALRPTRGAALAVAEIDADNHRLTFAGVGNVAAAVVAADATKNLPSQNGIVGHEMRTAHEFIHPWTPASCLIMHSDGIRARWQLGAYPGLVSHHPAVVAGTLFRDFARGRDDATVIAVRMRAP